MSSLYFWVEALESNSGIRGSELPIYRLLRLVSLHTPVDYHEATLPLIRLLRLVSLHTPGRHSPTEGFYIQNAPR